MVCHSCHQLWRTKDPSLLLGVEAISAPGGALEGTGSPKEEVRGHPRFPPTLFYSCLLWLPLIHGSLSVLLLLRPQAQAPGPGGAARDLPPSLGLPTAPRGLALRKV